MITPKPCPFCGKTNITTWVDHEQGTKWGRAVCDSYGSMGAEVRTGYHMKPNASWWDDAFEEWNKRALPEVSP